MTGSDIIGFIWENDILIVVIFALLLAVGIRIGRVIQKGWKHRKTGK